MKIKEAAIKYVIIKRVLTRCMSAHFRQLCNKCKEYDTCELYADYVQAWIDLQKAAERYD